MSKKLGVGLGIAAGAIAFANRTKATDKISTGANPSISKGTMGSVTNKPDAVSRIPKTIQRDERNPYGKTTYDTGEGGVFEVENSIESAEIDFSLAGTRSRKDKPGNNILHNYNSYNYIITLTSLSNEQIKDPNSYIGKVVTEGGVEQSPFYIVAKTGGYARSASTYGDFDGGDDYTFKATDQRTKDLFIENLTFQTYMGVNSPSGGNLTTGTFEVLEPLGVGGFYESLFNAARHAGHPSYAAAPFLLVISFVGHEALGGVTENRTMTVPRSTRYFPIMITKSSMKVTEAGARYSVNFSSRGHLEANKPGVTQLVDNLNGPSDYLLTVGKVIYDMFLKHNNVYQKKMSDAKGESKTGLKVPEKIDDAIRRQREEQIAQAKSEGLKVSDFQPHRWCVWFPSGYNGQFDLQAVNFETWLAGEVPLIKSNNPVSGMTAITKQQKEQFELAYQNDFSKAGMRETEFTYSGHFEVPEISEAIKAEKEVLDKDIAPKLAKAQKEAQDAQKIINVLRKEVDELSKKIGGTINYNEKADQSAYDDDQTTYPYYTYGYDPQAIQATTYSKTPDVLKKEKEAKESLDIKIKELNKEQLRLNNAQRDIEFYGNRYKKSADSLNTTATQKYKRYGSGKKAWQFKKGTTLESNIHNIILDSDYATGLADQGNSKVFNEIKTNHYIPWYRIDKFAKPIGYDSYYHTPVYEFHYLIVPYKIHYSKLAAQYGIQGVFNYDKALKRAVREYNYIYTGKNIDVLDFDIEYNNLFVQMSAKSVNQQAKGETAPATAEKTETVIKNTNALTDLFNAVGIEQMSEGVPQNRNKGSGMPTDNATQIAELLHDSLYNGTERGLLNAKLQIVGDPVFLVGTGIDTRAVTEEKETNDGEANIFSHECDIIFNFGFPGDTPTAEELESGAKFVALPQPSRYSGLYRVTLVENQFSEGQFKQMLQLVRRQNQKNDFVKQGVAEATIQLTSVPNPLLKPGDETQTNKMDTKPSLEVNTDKLSTAQLNDASEIGPIKSGSNFINEAAKQASSAAGNVANGVGTVVSNVTGAIKGTIGNIVGAIKGGVGTVTDAITNVSGKAPPSATDVASAVDKAKKNETTSV